MGVIVFRLEKYEYSSDDEAHIPDWIPWRLWSATDARFCANGVADGKHLAKDQMTRAADGLVWLYGPAPTDLEFKIG